MLPRALFLAGLLLATVAPSPGTAKTVEVPVDIGVGPAFHLISGPVFRDQPVHYGLKISVQAIIDGKTIRDNLKRLPSWARSAAKGVNEARISPSFLIPDTLIISPKYKDTGMVGIIWRPLALSLPLVRKPVRLALSAGLLVAYVYIHSDTLAARHTHFLRLGLDGRAELEIPFSSRFLISLGWSSGVYIPQVIGGGFFDLQPKEQFIWHVGQAFVMLHFRFPYKTKI